MPNTSNDDLCSNTGSKRKEKNEAWLLSCGLLVNIIMKNKNFTVYVPSVQEPRSIDLLNFKDIVFVIHTLMLYISLEILNRRRIMFKDIVFVIHTLMLYIPLEILNRRRTMNMFCLHVSKCNKVSEILMAD